MKAYTTPVFTVLSVDACDLLTASPMSLSNENDCGYTKWGDIVGSGL
ncbi:MAG: hypothetical protein IJW55_06295 [Clostridia bacterium]|nr:hypothetical protein [Clostridia bacterium]